MTQRDTDARWVAVICRSAARAASWGDLAGAYAAVREARRRLTYWKEGLDAE